MTEKEKSRPLVAQETGQVEMAREARFPCPNFITEAKERQPLVSDFLGRGPGNARHMKELKQLLNEDSRTIRRMIDHERRKQIPIVSDNQRG